MTDKKNQHEWLHQTYFICVWDKRELANKFLRLLFITRHHKSDIFSMTVNHFSLHKISQNYNLFPGATQY